MKLKLYLTLTAFIMLANSCAPGFYYQPDPVTTPQTNIFTSNGVKYAFSRNGSTSISLAAIKLQNGPLELSIVYRNDSLDRVDAIPDNIIVSTKGEEGLMQYHVYNADQYLAKLQRRQNFALAMQAGSAAYANSQAGYTKTTTTTNGVSPNGTYTTNAVTTTTYDANKAIAANTQSQQQIQQTANNYSNYDNSLNQQLIRVNTLFKGQSVAGYVMVNTSNSFSETIYVYVPFGEQYYTFVLVPSK